MNVEADVESKPSLSQLIYQLEADYDEHIYQQPEFVERKAHELLSQYSSVLDQDIDLWLKVNSIYLESLTMQAKNDLVYQHYLEHFDKVSLLPPSRELPYLLHAHAYACMHLSYCDALPLLIRAKMVAESFDNTDAILTVYATLADYYIDNLDYVHALLTSEKGLEVAQKTDFRDFQGAFNSTLGTIYLQIGQKKRAFGHLELAIQHFQQLEMKNHLSASTQVLMLAHFPDDMKQMKRYLEQLKAMGKGYYQPAYMPFYNALIAMHLDNDPITALGYLESIRDDYQVTFLYNRAAHYVYELSSIYLVLGRAQEARQLLNEFERYKTQIKYLPKSNYETALLQIKGRVSEALGDVKVALSLYRAYAEIIEENYQRRLSEQISLHQVLSNMRAMEEERDKLSNQMENASIALKLSERERDLQSYAVLVLFCAVLIVLLFFYRQTRVKNSLSKLAKIDVVTRVYTRMYLVNVIKRQPKMTSEITACCLIDLDDFKLFNDKYGHQYGDEVLQEVGRCLRKAFCDTNSIFGRWGGEEFLLMSWCSEQEIYQRIDVLKRLMREIMINGVPANELITATIGISLHPNNKLVRVYDCIEYADQLMYQGKSTGKDTVVSGCLI